MNRLPTIFAAASALILASACPAFATASYTFDVNWDGTTATLAGGSDPMVGTVLEPGDSFTYTLEAVGGHWNNFASGNMTIFDALAVMESGSRTSDYTLTFENLGSTVFTDTQLGVVNQCIHLGTNGASLPGGLNFDKIVLSDTLTSAVAASGDCLTITANPTDTTIASLLPIFGAPENNTIRGPSLVSFVSDAPTGVPEPITLTLFGAGLAGLSAVRRRRR